MTKAEAVRNNFKAFFPRLLRNDLLSAPEAIGRTTELLNIFQGEMVSAGLEAEDVSAGLIFTQPETPGLENVPAQSLAVPSSEGMAAFAEQIESLDRPVFLGVLFAQLDRETWKAIKFVWPFMGGPEAEKGLRYVRDKAPDIKMADFAKGFDA